VVVAELPTPEREALEQQGKATLAATALKPVIFLVAAVAVLGQRAVFPQQIDWITAQAATDFKVALQDRLFSTQAVAAVVGPQVFLEL
jgi:hypothetical protein